MRTIRLSNADTKLMERIISFSESIYDNKELALSKIRSIYLSGYDARNLNKQPYRLPGEPQRPFYLACSGSYMPDNPAPSYDDDIFHPIAVSLKAQRTIHEKSLQYRCKEEAPRGTIVCIDEEDPFFVRPTKDGEEYPVGVLLNDVIHIDSTYGINPHQDEAIIGEKVEILQKGEVVVGGVIGSPRAGEIAYATKQGRLTNEPTPNYVGTFISNCSGGFSTVKIDIQPPTPRLYKSTPITGYF